MKFWPFKNFETKSSLAAPDAELLALFGIGNPSSVAVPAAEAIKVPAVACAVRVISEAAATLERRVEVKGKRDDTHAVAKLLRGDANDWTTASELVRDLVAQALTQDAGGIAWVNRVDGRIAEIVQYKNGLVKVDVADTGEPSFSMDGKALQSADVIHIRAPFDRCPLTMACEAIGVARIMERHAATFFANASRPSGVIQFPKPLGDDGLKRMGAAWRAAFAGASNAGRVPILWDGANFQSLVFNSVDAQFLELRKFQTLEIARAFRTPPSMLYDLDRATWSNSEQMGKEFLTYSLEPWLQVLEGVLTRVLFTPDERETHRVVFDRDDLTRASLTDRATAINSLIASETINPNTGRDWLGLQPYDGGEKYGNRNINVQSAPEDDA